MFKINIAAITITKLKRYLSNNSILFICLFLLLSFRIHFKKEVFLKKQHSNRQQNKVVLKINGIRTNI